MGVEGLVDLRLGNGGSRIAISINRGSGIVISDAGEQEIGGGDIGRLGRYVEDGVVGDRGSWDQNIVDLGIGYRDTGNR